ncbi:phage major capsid protein [Candidatus Accumulibacter sp. ACC007]|uniref:phage major capsid protein n=1 Tax=Candidatus Accumulibacter sp. ACC007 TaxID=2823333 RepID=UPI0025BBBA3C|nr:phage major capsid protein [Candidatus Accumulibacter sp. ACC007]
MHFRTLTFGRADPAGRSVPVTVSTEEAVDRGEYVEILDHSPGGVDLSRAPLPLIESHDSSRLNIGTVENLQITNGKLTGTARFGTSQRAEEIFQDVKNRVVRSVSVGYQLTDDGTPTGDGRAIRFKWMPYEVSAVACPADTGAGFFRHYQDSNTMNQTAETTNDYMTRSQRNAAKGGAAAENAKGIIALARQFSNFDGVQDIANEAVMNGMSSDDFAARLTRHVSSFNQWTPEINMSRREEKQYSVIRAIESQLTGDWRNAGLEREVHETLAKGITHRNVTGVLIPGDVVARKMKRDLVTSTPSAGGNLVGLDHRADLFIDALREHSAVLGLGAQRVSGLVGNVDIPVLAGDVSPEWMSTETASITESEPVFGQLLLSPKSCAAYTQLSRRLIKQSGPAAEMLVTHSMMKAIGYSIDKAAIQGTGVSGQPIGLLLKTGLGVVTGASIDWPAILDFEADVSSSFVDLTGQYCGFVTTPGVRKLLKGRVKVAGHPEYLWQSPDNRMNGYAAMATTACPADHLIFGDWSEVIVAEWGPIEIVVNPYDQFAKALVGVRAIADIDIAIKHGGAFSVASSVS